jgi:cysteine desulfurase
LFDLILYFIICKIFLCIMLNLPVYLDHNATSPCDQRVAEVMMPFFTGHFGNAASRNHAFGWRAKEAADIAREQVANLIHAESSEIIFTSGATESVNLALKGVYELYQHKGNHIITCNIEHKAVLDTCHRLEKMGADVSYVKVNHDGLIDLQELESAFRPSTILVAVMYANNEVGTIMPVKETGALAKKKGVFFFCDATQAVGKIPVDVHHDGIDLLAFNAHKMYGPKGIGALYVRRKDPRVKLAAQIDGGGHEKGLRSGTLNVPGIVGFGKACEIAMLQMQEDAKHLYALRNKLENALLELEEVYVNGSRLHRLPHVSNLSFRYVEGSTLLAGFNKEIAVSTGSACMSASPEPSYVLKALGLGDELAHSSLRFSLGRFNTEEEIDFTIKKVSQVINNLRETSPLWQMFKQGTMPRDEAWIHH